MTRYFFDIHDANGFHRDEVGDEFADFNEVRIQAQALLSDVVRDEVPYADLHSVVCEVRDQSGKTVYRGEITYRGMQL